MMQFKAFKPQAMQKIAGAMGYTGDMNQFQNYIEQDPMRQQQMQKYNNAAMQMARGGVVKKMAEGGSLQVGAAVMPTHYNPQTGQTYTNSQAAPNPSTLQPYTLSTGPGAGGNMTAAQLQQSSTPAAAAPAAPTAAPTTINEASMQRVYQPGLPTGGVTQAAATPISTTQDVQQGTGELTGKVAVPTAMATTSQVTPQAEMQANVMEANTAAPAIDAAVTATQAAQASVDPRSEVTAAQQTASAVGNLQAAQGNAVLIDNPVQRSIQEGELISATANAETAAAFTEQVQAATATPSSQATVQGQLEGLMTQFEGGETPAWAAGAMRSATAAMAARGLGASSLAGQAIIQATMESALPIAQADAATIAQFEGQNLSNRQQSAMLAAQQRATFMGMEFDQGFKARVQNAARVSDIANMNFSAEQQVQLENSKLTNTVNLNNLSNTQAMVMAEAAALAQLDTQNLNNRQQSAVKNAESFLQTDLANLSNRQQTELFKNQQRVQSLFTDQAAENAARQFNATSQNQVDQFFANLSSQVSQFNSTQANAQAQFNAGEANTVERFNSEINNQRDQFNAQNQLVIAQANAQWRREIATADTVSVNRANELNANAILDISKTSYDNLWTYYSDTMEWAWKSAESELDRIANVAIAEIDADSDTASAKLQSSGSAKAGIGAMIGQLGAAAITKWCYVAREVYGPHNTDWVRFRIWVMGDSPKWFKWFYGEFGEAIAKYISDKPKLKCIIKYFMDIAVRKYK